MKRLIFLLIPFFIGLTVEGIGSGDRVNLSELKKKEEERRKKVKKSTYRVTNHNLNSIQVPPKKYAFVQMYTPTGSLAQEQIQDQTAAAAPAAGKKEDRQKTREYWTELKTGLEDEISELNQTLEKDQIELNGLVAQHLSMDLPLQKTALKDQIDQKAGDIATKRSRLTDLQRELNRLPEKARKAGVPAGWVR
jgi:hypothetical protein